MKVNRMILRGIVLKILEVNIQKEQDFSNDDDFFLIGFSSFNAIELITEIEDYYDITFDDSHLDLSKINTINKLALLIENM